MIVGRPWLNNCWGGAHHLTCGLAVIGAFSGCGPRAILPPKIDAAAASQAAISKYDRDGDGVLSAEELKQSPALAASHCDVNGDRKVTADEIVSRIDKWQTDRVGLITFHVQVTLNGKPLSDALVKLIPEDFIAGQIQPAQGTTNEVGLADIGMDPSQLREDLQGTPLMHCGIYRVEITHPQRKIPAQYNVETILGHEVAMDTIDIPYTVFALKSQ